MNYFLFNLAVKSDICLPNAPYTDLSDAVPDVSITRIDKLDINVASMKQVAVYCWCLPTSFLIHIPNLALCHVYDGKHIDIEYDDCVDMGLLTAYIEGYLFAILLQQRGHLVLHGTVLKKNEQAIAICGVSGAGKSTLALALIQQGWSLVSDDVCAFDKNGNLLAGCTDIKVWPDIVETLALGEQPCFSPQLEKRQITMEPQLPLLVNSVQPLRLAALYCIEPESMSISISEFVGMRKFAPLRANCYREQFLQAMETELLFMNHCSAFFRDRPVYKLQRDKHKLSYEGLNQLVNLVTDSLPIQAIG
ncbi:hypothetical protein [Shewanella sp. AC91-MNA-CIBAN-0169]|uniref:HPr kinase/phosphorylase n=1 Tax=Shewanella sp. AC91-MNA-CIBAN-0169 TaxID=3140466 RepID=UPI00331965A5